MNSNTIAYLFGLVIALVVVAGCEKKIDLSPSDLVFEELSIGDVKTWYSKQENNATGRIASSYKKDVLWNYYKSGTFNNGRPYIVTTLAYSQDSYLRADISDAPLKEFDGKFDVTEGLFRKGLFFKDIAGNYQKYVLYIIPDAEYAKQIKKGTKRKIQSDEFSGLVLVKDWYTEDFVDGWRMLKGKFKSQVILSSKVKKPSSGGRVASGYCSYVTYGTLDCVQIPCPGTQSVPNSSGARIAASPQSKSCQSCEWVSTGSDGYCEGDGSTTYTGQIGAGAFGGGGTYSEIPSGSSLNQVMANLVNTYSAQLNSTEESYLLDCDDLELAESMTQALRLWANLSITELEDLTVEFLDERINEQERQILRGIEGENYYRIHLLRYLYNADRAQFFTQFNFNNDQVNGLQASKCAWCTGNAFKHAIFRIFDAMSFGRPTSIALGNAHETNNPVLGQQKDRDMDIYNNGKGIEIFNGRMQQWLSCNGTCRVQLVSSFVQDINERIANGQLKYIIMDPAHINNVEFDKLVYTDESGASRL